jgi:hypothetical protein
MDTIELDLHKRESQLCSGHPDGTISERRIATSRERFTASWAVTHRRACCSRRAQPHRQPPAIGGWYIPNPDAIATPGHRVQGRFGCWL